MTRYPYLLFDADNTLFDFDEANVSSFRAVCAPRASPPTAPSRATASFRVWFCRYSAFRPA